MASEILDARDATPIRIESRAFAAVEWPRDARQVRQGSNSRSSFGYIGPPAGDPPHRYHFQLFALDTTLELPSGFNRHALLKAREGTFSPRVRSSARSQDNRDARRAI